MIRVPARRGWSALVQALTLGLWLGLATPARGELLLTDLCCHTPLASYWTYFVEFVNTGPETVMLNDGIGGWYLTADPDYWELPGLVLPVYNRGGRTVTFPAGTTVAPGGAVLVVYSDTDFVGLYGIADLWVHGNPPLLFERVHDADTTLELVPIGGASSSGPDSHFVALFFWDGLSDTVQDGDIVGWEDAAWPDRASLSVDGPDLDTLSSAYPPDSRTGTILPAFGNSSFSWQRTTAAEPGEGPGGNGFWGEDETAEDLVSSFTYAYPTPGWIPTWKDGELGDLALATPPIATSPVDGPTGNAGPGDLGSDATITELYALPVDDDGDFVPDLLRLGLRGQWFDNFPTGQGLTIGLDLDPGAGTGITRWVQAGDTLSDLATPVAASMTHGGLRLDGDLISAGFGLDLALVVTEEGCSTSGACGGITWGSAGLAGSVGATSVLVDQSAVAMTALAPDLAGAWGTSFAAPDALEWDLRLDLLGFPTEIALVAFVTTEGVGPASPNSLPESPPDFLSFNYPLQQVVCVSTGNTPPATCESIVPAGDDDSAGDDDDSAADGDDSAGDDGDSAPDDDDSAPDDDDSAPDDDDSAADDDDSAGNDDDSDDDDAHTPPPDCGCSSGSGAWIVLPVMLVPGWRRSRERKH